MSTKAKRSTRRRPAAKSKSKSKPQSPRRRRAPAPEVEAFEQAVDAATSLVPAVPVAEHEPEVPLSTPERGFASRVAPPAPDRPHPDRRRAIFFDVENTSRAEHIARVIEHLAVNREAARTEFIAVGNWRVIGHDTARLLAKHGAQLVHSAPSVGVRDWSDLRIAVGAGVWLAAARAGDVIELVSDDRAFDAVGDVAASLGISFHRLSFRRLAGMRAGETVAEVPAAPAPSSGDSRGGGHGRRRRGRGGRGRPHAPAPPAMAPRHEAPPPPPSLPHAEVVATNGEPAVEPHTAPHDEIINVVRELLARSRDGSVTIDTLANGLKSRGFRRPPGSPRLITRLRRIREIVIDRNGRITLVGGTPAAPAPEPAPAPPEQPPVVVAEERPARPEPDGNRAVPPARVEDDFEDEGPMPGNERVPSAPSSPPPSQRRRWSRRGGRGRRHGRSGAPAAP